tara:strand:- start:1381 stop:2760 length:1380 start_codon:yes stop_codon:yes gene_type:complete
MNIALIGLGSMGYNLAKNMVSKNYHVNAFEKNMLIVEKIKNENIQNLYLLNSIKDLVDKTPSPRIIMLSLPADKIDKCINDLIDHLNPTDTIADLGNSLYLKSIEREKLLSRHNISFLGIGVSGGPRGAKNGPAIMAGGSKNAWENVKNIFEDISAKNNDESACCYFGSSGSGHFVKLVHNGIEYALMEGLAEISNVLEYAYDMDNNQRARKFKEVLQTQSSSFLLEITSEILNAKNINNEYFIDETDNKIGQNGTGIWTINAALELGVSIPSIYEAVSTRSISDSFDYKFEVNKKNQIMIAKVDDRELALEEIIFFNFVCSLYQGLSLIKESNVWDFFDYKIDDVFKAWSAGCILQGNYLNFISQKYKTDKTLNFEFLFNLIEEKCSSKLRLIREFNSNAIKFGLPCPVLSSNLAYYDLIFSKHKIGETIQLQRSFFGLHPLKDKKSNDKIKPYWTKL